VKNGRIAAFVAAALIAGVVVGNAASGFATAPTATTDTQTATGMGMRLGGVMRDAGGRLADVVAKLTGMSVEDVQAQREAGTSFADIASTKDISADKVVDEAVSTRKTVLSDKVKEGAITQDQADAAVARMQDRLTDRVTSTDAGCDGTGGKGGRMGSGRGNGSGGGTGCGGACTAQ